MDGDGARPPPRREWDCSLSPSPLSLVLDTNVVLDLLVYADPTVRALAGALEAGRVLAWAEERTLQELDFVLARPHFQLDEARRRELSARYRGQVRRASEPPALLPELPRCRDRSDQKFLELAARVGAVGLVSKDKRVLSMADHRGLPFSILSPRQLAERLAHGVAPRPC